MSENDSIRIAELELKIKQLQHECDFWRKTAGQLTQTIDKLLVTCIGEK